MEWFFRHTNKSSSLEPNVWSPLACERAQRKKVRVRAYGEVFSVHTRRVHCSCHCLDAKLPERTKTEKCARLRMEAAFKWIWQWLRPCRSDFPYKSPHTSRVWRSWRCRCYRWSHHSLSCHPWECRACHWWSPRWRTPPHWAFCPFWGWRWWEIRRSVETQPLQVLLDRWIQCVILSCSQLYWNVRYSFALSSLKAGTNIRWWFTIRSLTQWSCLFLMLTVFSHRSRCR